MPNPSSPAFISYSREDSTFALQLAKDLKASGVCVWLDQLEIKPGENWDVAVEAALANATRVLVLLSPASVQSPNVLDEVSFALDGKKIVIPVLHRDCEIPLRLHRLQYINFGADPSQAFTEISKILRGEEQDVSDSGAAGPVEKPKRGFHFEFDVFISYAHADNLPLTVGQSGWISRFRASLEATLSMKLGRKARIRLDAKLSAHNVFTADEIEGIHRCALLVTVLSPQYLSSEYCMLELQKFHEAAEQAGGVLSDNRSRIVKVIKTPVENEESLPAACKNTIDYPFWGLTQEDSVLELDPAYGSEFAEQFSLRMTALSSDMAKMITDLEASSGNEADT